MSGYKDALFVDARSSERHLALAAERLATGAGTVVLDGTIALRPTPAGLLCDVLDPAPASRRCEYEFEVLVENARRLLESSRLGHRLPEMPRRWRVVDDGESGTVELWRAK